MDSKLVNSSGMQSEKPKREKKGKSLIDFPESYIVIDIETTGLYPEYDSIIEIAALKIEDGKCIDTFCSLVKPEEYLIKEDGHKNDYPSEFVINEEGKKTYYIDSFISELTGITNTMLHSAPKSEMVLPRLKSFLSNSIVVGHNVNFDINFLYDEFMTILAFPIENNFIDTMRIARRVLTELPHHRLIDLAVHYSISSSGSHRALKDCEITNNCYLNLKNEVLRKYGSMESFINVVSSRTRSNSQTQKAKDILSSNNEFDNSHPLFNKRCVFTGTLENMVRKDAMQLVVDIGGINEDNVTGKTNYLILGNNDYCSTIKDGKSAKQKKAESFKLKGNDIEIIPESIFYDLINDK